MSKGKGKAKRLTETGYYSDVLASQIAGQLFKETQPMREAYYGAFKDITEGEMPFGQTAFPAMYGAGKAPIESQYGMARRNILEAIPRGGLQAEALTDVETARARGLQDLVAGYLTDQLNKMYGTAFGIPQTSISGLLGVGQHAVQTATAASQAGAQGCCFNFLEAEGEIYRTVRQYRDEHYSKTSNVAKGYIRSANIFVPLMRKHEIFKQILRLAMTKPLKSYANWYYKQNRYGFIFWPIAKGWVNYWRLLGMGV